jgi:hypothetical protein
MRFAKTFILLLLLASPLPADELRTLGAKTITGTVTSINESEIILKTENGPVSTPMSQVLALNIRTAKPLDPAAKYNDVRLLDDTVLHCRQTTFKGNQVELTLLSGVTIKLPLNFVVSFVRDAQNAPLARKFEELASKRIKRDRIVILREGEANSLEGSLGEVDAEGKTIKFKSEATGTVVDLPFERLHGFIFYRSETPSESPICKVYDTEGNSLMALKLNHDGTKLTLTTTFGASVTLPQEAIARFDFNMGKLTFLSDMQPTKVIESFWDPLDHWRRDTNLDNQPILLDKQYLKGITVRAKTDMEFNLAGKYKDFKAILGIDVRTGATSQPQVTIYCDGVEQFSETITSAKVRPININVKDVTTLRILVSPRSSDNLNLDHVTLAEARVSQ